MLETEPDSREISTLIGLFNSRRLGDAEVLARSLTERFPGHQFGWEALGAVLGQAGQVQQALPALQKAAELSPEDPEAQNNLGNAQRSLGQLLDAESSYEMALRIRPDFVDALSGLGNTLCGLSKLDEAYASYRRALATRPDSASVRSNFLLLLNSLPGLEPEEIYAHHQEFERQCCAGIRWADHANNRDAGRRLKIGYVSADFRDHAAAYFIEPVLEMHDRRSTETYCYYVFAKTDAVTRRLKSLADHWRDVAELDDDALAKAIREDEIDILVDLGGHTANNRLLAFARKPAPIQVTWLGYLNTTGMRAMDYRITDAHAAPPGAMDACHSEKVIRLPHSQWCYRPPEISPDIDRARRDDVTFAIFSNAAKLNDLSMQIWARLLIQVPKARLLVVTYGLNSPETVLTDRFERCGVPKDRLAFAGSMPFQDYLRMHNSVDVVLDTFPYTGGTTTCHALWMGVPVVSLAGVTATSRGGASLLQAVGLPELIAADEQGYIDIAAGLANDRARHANIFTGLRERMRSSPVTDGSAFTRRLEDAYRAMWRAWCEGRQ